MIKIFKEITNVLGCHFNKITLIDTSVKINRTDYCLLSNFYHEWNSKCKVHIKVKVCL